MHELWSREQGQDVAEYAIMLALILVLVIGTLHLVGEKAKNAFSRAAGDIQHQLDD
jgi:Flp pilus assembly pilin Flp